MTRIGLTGGVATGKSYVARLMREADVPVVDSDVLAREAVAPGTPELTAIVERFGPEILMASGELDRARLGEQVFRDAGARRDLEAIVHPVVRRGITQFFRALPPGTPLAVADIPLLFETHGERNFDKVIVVACLTATQIERVIVRDGLSREAAAQRVAAQLPIEEKVRRADYVIRTDGTFAETDAQVAAVLASLRS
jgi:dephospho-CoA kinase